MLKMARMNRANELTSRQLAQFLSDSNQHIFRAKLEIVRDQAVNRMKMKESLLTSLFQTDDYNKLLLLDIYCPELQQRILHHNDPQLVHLSSRILQLEEHFALLCNMMK